MSNNTLLANGLTVSNKTTTQTSFISFPCAATWFLAHACEILAVSNNATTQTSSLYIPCAAPWFPGPCLPPPPHPHALTPGHWPLSGKHADIECMRTPLPAHADTECTHTALPTDTICMRTHPHALTPGHWPLSGEPHLHTTHWRQSHASTNMKALYQWLSSGFCVSIKLLTWASVQMWWL